jgi:predicted DNA-binding protein (UPF0251 family)
MPAKKMMPPLPESNESPHQRFKRFTKAILAVPRSEIETVKKTGLLDMTPEEALERLEAERQNIDANLKEVRREIAKRKATIPKSSAQ